MPPEPNRAPGAGGNGATKIQIPALIGQERAGWYVPGSGPSAIGDDLSRDVRSNSLHPSSIRRERGAVLESFGREKQPTRSSIPYPTAPFTASTTGPLRQNKVPLPPLRQKWQTKRATPTIVAAAVALCEAAGVWSLFLYGM